MSDGNPLYAEKDVEEIRDAAFKYLDVGLAMHATLAIMTEAFPDFNRLTGTMMRVNDMLVGGYVNKQLEARGLPKLDADTVHFMNGPIIYHSGLNGWGPEHDGHPVHNKDLARQIREERIENALGLKPYIVGPTEFMCVMYAATMDASLSYTATEVYIWAAAHAMDKRTGMGSGHTYSMLGHGMHNQGPRHLTDHEILNEAPWREFYRQICTDIRRKVIAHEKQRRRERREPKNEPQNETPASDLFTVPDLEKPAA